MIAGDWGADDGLIDGKPHVVYPGSDPSIISCGGTVLAAPNSVSSAWQEVAWSDANAFDTFGTGTNQTLSDFGATGGGASAIFPVPSYQSAAGITQIKDSKGNVHVGRFIPDVSGMVGHAGFFVNKNGYNFTGTSCVAPMYAGLTAVLQEAFGFQIGFLNPIFYRLGSGSFNDVGSGGNNDSADTPDSPFFNTSGGWDPVTGWGSIDGTKLLTGISQQLFNRNLYFVVDKNTFGLDEVKNVNAYPNAFWLVLEGFAPNSLTAGAQPTLSGGFNFPGNIDLAIGSPIFEISSQPATPQRISFPCTVTFTPNAARSINNGGLFPEPGTATLIKPLAASFSILGQSFAAIALFDLVAGADPFFINVSPAANNSFYLSQNLRIFNATQFPNVVNTPVPGGPQFTTSPGIGTFQREAKAGFDYIQNLLKWMNQNYSNPQGPDPFNTLLPNQSGALFGYSFVQPDAEVPGMPDGPRYLNYPFAIASVRLSGTPGASTVKNVRVFFRLFVTQTSDTDFDPNKTYPSGPDNAGLPGFPILGLQHTTIPFFATGNLSANADFGVEQDYIFNSVNNQPIVIGSSGSVWAYYGCFLNIYAADNLVDGKPVFQQLVGSHNCLVAQIAFDDTPIPISQNGATTSPETSDKLAQRNLQITVSDNPGPPSAHRIPQTFDVRPSGTLATMPGLLLDYPDELIIDWGNTPPGSTASIYWPAVTVTDVLSLSERLYTTSQLSAAAAPNTIQCTVPNGQTYIPIPPSTSTTNENFAGLFTIDLPQGVKLGEEFLITVRRVSTCRRELVDDVPKIAGVSAIEGLARRVAAKSLSRGPTNSKITTNWRYIVGSFAVRIPVTTKEVMLQPEENTLAIMKWRLEGLDKGDRWWPVMDRYVQFLSERVDGLGGNASAIPPNPNGGTKGGQVGLLGG